MIPGAVGEIASAVVAKLLAVVRMRDPELADHGVRTAHVAAAVATEIGLTGASVDRVYLGGLLHDVGKLGVPEEVLWKPEGLAAKEWGTVPTHPEAGHGLVADIVDPEVAACVLYHHERMDSDGYPFRLDLRTLPLAVRIVQVADAFDAITSVRPYAGAVGSKAAVAEIRRCAGEQFDPDVVAAFERLLSGSDRDTGLIALSAEKEPPAGGTLGGMFRATG